MTRSKKMQETDSNFFDVNYIRSLAHEINYICIRGYTLVESFKDVTKILANHSKCDVIRLWLKEGRGYYSWGMNKFTRQEITFDSVSEIKIVNVLPSLQSYEVELDYICKQVLRGPSKTGQSHFTRRGSYWCNDLRATVKADETFYDLEKEPSIMRIRTLVMIPVMIGIERAGLLVLAYDREDLFSDQDILYLEDIAETIGITFAHIRTQTALRERVKELTCLYGIAKVTDKVDKSLDDFLNSVVEMLPPGWQYPEITSARISFDGREYVTANFTETQYCQTADISIQSTKRGYVQVCYEEIRQELDEGPFLIEERHLINTIARQLSIIIERKEAAAEKEQLRDQIKHADRLATIGQLAAGVAHEINEPLGNILGFAQLAAKSEKNPEETNHDLKKIVDASLHAREVIRKLLIFARQVPSQHKAININKTVEAALYFFESRFLKSSIEIVKKYGENLPPYKADPTQLSQVLINLVVNAMHAMPDGGTITIETYKDDGHLILTVEDTGTGISEEVQSKMFIPFFTTKDVNEGTGLGLAVVHGIVTAHKGTINVKTEVGKGTRLELRFPLNSSDQSEEKD